MLRALERHAVTALLGQRFLGHVLGVFEAFALAADILHELGIGIEMIDEVLLHLPGSQPGDETEPFAPGDLVHHLQRVLPVPPGEIQAARALGVEHAFLPALHDEGGHGAEGDGVQAVGVAVEVDLHDGAGIEDADVGAAAAHGLVLGAVDGDAMSLVRAGQQLEAVRRLGAGHGAAEPAAVGQPVGDKFIEGVRIDLGCIGVPAELEVVRGQQVVLVHDLDEVGGADLAHPALLVVQGDDLLVELQPGALERVQVGGIVGLARQARILDHDRLDLLVAEHRADAAAAGLLEPRHLAAPVIEGEVQAPDQGVLGAAAGAHRRDVHFLQLVVGEQLHHLLGQDVAVHRFSRGLEDLNQPLVAVDVHDDVALGLALDLEGVETGELQVGAEIAAHVAVDGNVGERGDGHHQRFSRTRVVGVAADGPHGDVDLVLGIVPARGVGDGVPKQLQAETLAPGEFLLHLLGNRFFPDLVRRDVHIQRAHVIAAHHRPELVAEFLEQNVPGLQGVDVGVDLGVVHRCYSSVTISIA